MKNIRDFVNSQRKSRAKGSLAASGGFEKNLRVF